MWLLLLWLLLLEEMKMNRKLVELLDVVEEQRNEAWWDAVEDAIAEEKELEMEVRTLIVGC